MPPDIVALIERTNPRGLRGGPDDLLAGADLLLGVSAAGTVSRNALRSMAPDAIVFALASPIREIDAEKIPDNIAIVATGRADYPNQINHMLASPGVLKGALKARACTIDETMKLAAAQAIANTIPDQQLNRRHIVPSVFDHQVIESIAHAVAHAARTSGTVHHGDQNGRTRIEQPTTDADRADERHNQNGHGPVERIGGSIHERSPWTTARRWLIGGSWRG
jgi:malic enzyme